jgi:putative NADH-flavin reductase
MARNSLGELEFPDAPVLRWQGEQTLKALKEKGVNLYAIIGPASVIDDAAEHIKKRYTFDQNQKEQTVKDWQEVMERLSESDSKNSQKSKKK